MSQTHFCSFRAPKLSIPTNQKNQWYITLWVQDPSNNSRYIRVKKMDDINTFQSYKERMKRAKYWLQIYEQKLLSGWNPIIKEIASAPPPKLTFTLSYSIDLYLREKKLSVSNKTNHKYTYFLNGFLDWINIKIGSEISLTDISLRNILDYRNEQLAEKTWGNKNSNTFITACSTFFKYMTENYEHVISKNPVKHVKKLTVAIKGNKAYSEDQITALRKAMEKDNPYLYFFCQVIYNTCTRPQAETRLLKCGDFDFRRKVLCIRSDISKTSVTQYIPLSDTFISLLIEQGIDKAPIDLYVFTQNRRPGTNPLHQETILNWFNKIKKDLGLGREYTLYSWKHTRNIVPTPY